MKILRVVPLALALWTVQAAADPFDTYQLIEWQERTPVQVEGLKRLGFTATKLRGTGGAIDPAELAAHVASGLPWYLENIATDFYAPYHRYIEGQPVNALFEAAKARRRADPADTTVFVRTPSLSDPVWIAKVQDRLASVVRAQAQYHPLFYNLADESGIGDLTAFWDADTGPLSLAAMREWLRQQYPSLGALNQEWGTDFANWDAVTPELTDQAMRRTDDNYASWADFKAWMDVAYARAVRAGTDAVHRADPAALAGLEGAQLPGWGGYDYSLLAPSVDVMEILDVGNALDLVRAFNPTLIPLRTSFGAGPREHHDAWQHMLRGGRGMIVWDSGDDIVLPDGSPGPRGRDLGALAAAIRTVAPTIMASKPAPDPVAVLISQASFRTRWMLDQRYRGAAWSDRDAAHEYEDNAWRASRRGLLQVLGELAVEPHLLSSSMVEDGALQLDGIRVLILPHVIALSVREADAIKAFAQGGGTVLADTEPGVFDAHSRRLPTPLLAGIARVPEGMWLNGDPDTPWGLDGQAALLTGIVPRATLRGPDGQRATGVDARWFRHGDALLLALQTIVPWGASDRIEVDLPAPEAVRDLRAGGPARVTNRIPVILDPIEPTILELRPQ